MFLPDAVPSQQTTIASGTAETTIVSADPNFRRNLRQLVITTANSAAATLTLRDATGGSARAIIDYPNAAAAPVPLTITFDPALLQTASNNNWTLQASAAVGAIHITASYVTGN